MTTFSTKFKELRETSNIKQKDLAEYLSVTPRAIRNYESGIHEPSYEKLILIAKIFNVSTDYLLGLSDDPTRH